MGRGNFASMASESGESEEWFAAESPEWREQNHCAMFAG